jgi:hypothetical protein
MRNLMQPRASVISAFLIVTAAKLAAGAVPDVHVWEKQELTFTSQRSFKNPVHGRAPLRGLERSRLR